MTLAMRNLLLTSALALLVATTAGLAPTSSRAEAAPSNDPAESQISKEPGDPSLPVYKPPPKAKYPRARVGGITRGSLGKDPMVVALVPDHVAETFRPQPTLYWYISQTTTLPIIFTLREDEAVRPALETPLAPPRKPGIQVIRLKDFGVELKETITYRWFVSVQRDHESPSQDIVTGGMIERVPYSDLLVLCPGFTDRDPFTLARCGLWYDALRVISEKIDESPQDLMPHRQRAALLKQVGLHEIAELDLKPDIKP